MAVPEEMMDLYRQRCHLEKLLFEVTKLHPRKSEIKTERLSYLLEVFSRKPPTNPDDLNAIVRDDIERRYAVLEVLRKRRKAGIEVREHVVEWKENFVEDEVETLGELFDQWQWMVEVLEKRNDIVVLRKCPLRPSFLSIPLHSNSRLMQGRQRARVGSLRRANTQTPPRNLT